MHPIHPTVALALAVALASATSLDAQDYYTDVRPVLVEKCMGCHSEDGPSWSMEDAERTYGRARRIARAIDLRRMPPFLAEGGHQEYVGDLSLDEATVEMVRAWGDAGYPKGEARPDPDPKTPMQHAGHRFESEFSLDVLPGQAYLPNQESSDDYRCFLVDWEGEEETFMTGFRADPGNRNVAHHVVVYAVEPSMWDRYREIESIEDGPGYTCFGGALPDRLGDPEVRAEYESRYPDGVREMNRANYWLAHWAPGMDGHVFPEGTGIRMKPGSGLVVQMHYYGGAAPGEVDEGTRMDFMTADAVERPAFHLAQTRGDWLRARRNESMVIPAGEIKSYEMRDHFGDMLGYFGFMAGVDPERIEAVEVHSANLHMHSFGHSGEIVLRHRSGWSETLLSIPRWDLGWQRDFTFTAPKVIDREAMDGTWLSVRCTYENTTEGPVYGGYGSMDEMCFNFSYIAVREVGSAVEAGEPRR